MSSRMRLGALQPTRLNEDQRKTLSEIANLDIIVYEGEIGGALFRLRRRHAEEHDVGRRHGLDRTEVLVEPDQALVDQLEPLLDQLGVDNAVAVVGLCQNQTTAWSSQGFVGG